MNSLNRRSCTVRPRINRMASLLAVSAAAVFGSQAADLFAQQAMPVIAFQQADLPRREGALARIFIRRTVAGVLVTNGTLTVPYSIGGDATANVDYTLRPTGSITFPDGSYQAALDINTVDDTIPEATETLDIELGAGDGYTIDAALGTLHVTILDNDTAATAGNPVPVITSLLPPTAPPGGRALTITVNGSGFVESSVVHWSGAPVPTTYVSGSQLLAHLTNKQLRPKVENIAVTVMNPAPGGGESAPVVFTISKK